MTADDLQRIAGERAVPRRWVASAGHALEPATRASMEAGLGHSFADVRVHADVMAAEAAHALGARAFTVGRDVVFGAGEFAPGTAAGRRLLAHELAHVVQQRDALGVAATRVAAPDAPAERAAHRASDAVASGGRADAADLAVAPAAVHRQELVPPRPAPSPTVAALLASEVVDSFPLERHELSPEQRRRVAEVGRQIVQLLDGYPGGAVTVVGHTDATGEEAQNLGLGQRRADAVRDALVEAGVPADAVSTVSKGESQPLVPTSGPEPRNRRVEIRFHPRLWVRLEPGVLHTPAPAPSPLTPLPPVRDETPDERVARILGEPAPAPYEPPRFGELLWRRLDERLDPVLRKLPEKLRGPARSLAHAAVKKGTTTGLESALGQARLGPTETAAVIKAVEALLQEAR